MKLVQHIVNLLPEKLYDDEGVKQYEARLIAEEVSGLNYTELFTYECNLNEKQQALLQRIIDERSTSKPLAYVLKSVTFRELDLYVDERVLIPRPETELLVEEVLDHVKDIEEPYLLDIGTGSGAIALSIAQEHSSANVVGVDISQDAIDVANLNLAAVGSAASRVSFLKVRPSFWGKLDTAFFDIIVSNPPYIGEDEKDLLPSQVLDFEPHIALFADDEGFAIYEQIIVEARNHLKGNGVLILEIAPRHVEKIKLCATEYGYSKVEIINDFAGRERVAKLVV